MLCYVPVLGWIAAVIVLASDRFKRDLEIRFHAFQGLYLFFAWLLVHWIISPIFRAGRRFGDPSNFGTGPIGGILSLLILAGWIVMLIKSSKGEHYRLPLVGDLAERSVAEQEI